MQTCHKSTIVNHSRRTREVKLERNVRKSIRVKPSAFEAVGTRLSIKSCGYQRYFLVLGGRKFLRTIGEGTWYSKQSNPYVAGVNNFVVAASGSFFQLEQGMCGPNVLFAFLVSQF